MTWHTAAPCTEFSHSSSPSRVSSRLVLMSLLTASVLDVFLFSPPCAEPMCAVGQGVSALCCATEGQKWIFSDYSLTGVSILLQGGCLLRLITCVRAT